MTLSSAEGSNFNDRLIGGTYKDKLFGAAGNNILTDDWGNDQLFGVDGSDLINDGFGYDRMGAQRTRHSEWRKWRRPSDALGSGCAWPWGDS